MIKYKFFLIIFLFLLTHSYGQIEFRDNTRKTLSVIEHTMKDLLLDNSYLVYSSKYQLFLFVRLKDSYIEFEYAKQNNDWILSKISQNNHYMMKELFDKKNYIEGYIDSSSEFYYENDYIAINDGLTYFKNNFEGNDYAEYVLAIILKPVPMNKDVYRYISFKLLNIDFDSW